MFSFLEFFFRFRDIYVFVLCNAGSNDVIDRSTKTVQHSIKITSGYVKAVFLKLGTRNAHHKKNKRQVSCRCHNNSYAAGPVLITTKISRFHLTQGWSTPNNLLGRVKTMWEPCLFRGRPPVALQKVANRDIWFFTERDWNQGCCHGNDIVGVILFLLWCTLLGPSLRITVPVFLEIFSIQYFIVFMALFMTSSLSSFA